MIAEKLNIKFDIERIQNYFNKYVKHLEPVQQNEMFGGWSILSTSGDYRDGFQQTEERFYIVDQVSGEYKFDYERANREIGYTWPKMHINPTQVGTEYIAEIIDTIYQLGLQPHHARWTRISPHGTTIWHRDTWENSYKVRLHIPVITNPACKFETEEGAFHMPADGFCYLVAVNCLHKAYNHGNEDRIHIIMDVIDDVGISKYHRTANNRLTNKRFINGPISRVIKKIWGS
ncbi:aspartyl/asparaginyl beta-hydroxylase domain-containing protein [Legionella longbeachae]|uniref:Aspartyl/asparaginy/proline hydroxylase domain-containing protein n=1 Tax=Legionella longbeachae serogroup 1 (strain NSW150) TaxID=661367 RepID=D3HLW8_LEGLN|nr:aspartyl/asparaginyl beta-hydroxylase domain-containing protein [Legionella longbeachae]VEE03877.1 Aspartyl/Asparaginyl beta-hydroxylase [Legionella oakridgensis]HBD7397341.1 aspartyl/asparaginyl beta-hydroxylase domain-containing protein [Legionella pneumophila]ARB93265.1 hypothetical protein A6J40_14250 [Legionella longbeachae]ARM33671.1 aspartyl/asparaginyl beta-hydroxylase domain-containing protein [Legionella longbeachae]EEZ93485.1 conserved hypothetical protein [Legionella longbeachae